MRITPLVQTDATAEENTIGGVLGGFLRNRSYDQLQVAMAYVSVAGARTVLDACAHVPDLRSEWLVGLDDLVTQPGAIDLVRGLGSSDVRVASLGARPYRFHPKVCRFRASSGQHADLVMVGSANLTRSALTGNGEAVLFLEGDSESDTTLFNQMWHDLWIQGHAPADEELANYRARYELARPLRAQVRELVPQAHAGIVAPVGPILAHDAAELDPSQAQVCWIECGRVTAMGRELELKAEQGLFFGLNPALDDEQVFTFRVSDGSDVLLRLKYQQNSMWRVQMNNEVPEVRAGLRPVMADSSLGRSEFVAVFSRRDVPGQFSLEFLHMGSPEFEELKARSAQLGTSSRTRLGADGRDYGWC